HEGVAPDLAEDVQRHVVAAGELAELAQVASSEREHHAGLALAEEERVAPDAALERDPRAHTLTPEAALPHRHPPTALAARPGPGPRPSPAVVPAPPPARPDGDASRCRDRSTAARRAPCRGSPTGTRNRRAPRACARGAR